MRYFKRRKIAGEPRVSVVAAAYVNGDPRLLAALECFLSCWQAQTWGDWELLVVHDGPGDDGYREVACRRQARDGRLRFLETPERRRRHGHPWRAWGIARATGAYLGLTNADNYYVPAYLEIMLDALVNGPAEFAHCDMVHSHQHWAPFPTVPRKRKIDLGCWLASASLVQNTPWPGDHFNADGDFIESLARKARGVRHVGQYLFVHN